ncbi:hypothetical protein BCF74_10917 [Knoellia remsis]|uniref:Ribonuclease VapC n=1 Tax=Knoellia remsis TaxID=407159 RepID=A0A2T0UND8_9MICO|nr:type II toxin-antitoxin system VapC family toxin [Knoellia remsis]PRY59430.1 hypothetical protein BCF74_10917 [Knoellia remsis]
MIIPDVNLLVYAVFDGYPQHERAAAWLVEALNGAEEFALTAPAIFGFIRLATSARIHERPLSVAAATEYVDEWLARPQSRFLGSSPENVRLALGLLEAVGTGASLTTDAQLAAHAVESGGTVFSNDRDFGRFAGVRWVNPLD